MVREVVGSGYGSGWPLSNVMLLSCAAQRVPRHSRGTKAGSNGAQEHAICRVEMHQRRETPSAAEEWSGRSRCKCRLRTDWGWAGLAQRPLRARRRVVVVVALPLERCTTLSRTHSSSKSIQKIHNQYLPRRSNTDSAPFNTPTPPRHTVCVDPPSSCIVSPQNHRASHTHFTIHASSQ